MVRRSKVVEDKKEPQYERAGQNRAQICTAAWADMRALLLSLPSDKSSPSKMVEAAVKHQLDVSPGESPVEFAALLKSALEQKGVQDTKLAFTWDRLPYAVRCAGLAQSGEDGDRPRKKGRTDDEESFVKDVDEWILRNESFLRLLSRASKAGASLTSWTDGLLRLSDITVVARSTSFIQKQGGTDVIAFKLGRLALNSLPGYTVLGEKRREAVYLQLSDESFRRAWDTATSGVLKGLDWSNVFVAGGLVLGTLLTPSLPSDHPDASLVHSPDEWKSSDIDLYIYGLDVDSANAKIRHIADVYKKNLLPNAPFLIVRNSQTITLYSEWPYRRVQMVLKLVKDPREVLLNFDLDICAVGFDGTRPWILPRCIRALETGTNVFTMDLINGHYLGDRKATRDQRVFKYANKGYGIRILPSYVAALSTYATKERLLPHTRGERLYVDLSLESRAKEAREWTKKVIADYKKVDHKNSPFHWPAPYPKVESERPVFSHAMLESYYQVTSEPLGRSCLTGFTLFMRHVALWEEEVAGNIKIFDNLWATDTYGDSTLQMVAYDDSPAYTWDSSFTMDGFKKSMDDFNRKEQENIEYLDTDPDDISTNASKSVARLTYSDSVEEVFTDKKDVLIPLVLPKPFFEFAGEMLSEALKDACPQCSPGATLPLVALKSIEEPGGDVLALWRLDAILNWQMIDRRIDEIREALWSFHRAYERWQTLQLDSVYDILRTNISRRAIRTSVQDEMEAFVRWVGRIPYHERTKLAAHYYYGEVSTDDEFDDGTSDEDDDE